MKAKTKKTEWDQMFHGQSFTVDTDTEIYLACCDCGLVHKVKITLEKEGKKTKYKIRMYRESEMTNELREKMVVPEIEDGFVVKVSKQKEKRVKKPLWQRYS